MKSQSLKHHLLKHLEGTMLFSDQEINLESTVNGFMAIISTKLISG